MRRCVGSLPTLLTLRPVPCAVEGLPLPLSLTLTQWKGYRGGCGGQLWRGVLGGAFERVRAVNPDPNQVRAINPNLTLTLTLTRCVPSTHVGMSASL